MLQVRQRKSGKYDFLTREILLSLQRKVIVGELGQRLPPTKRQNGPRTFSNTKPYLEQHLQFDFNCICFKKRYLYFGRIGFTFQQQLLCEYYQKVHFIILQHSLLQEGTYDNSKTIYL